MPKLEAERILDLSKLPRLSSKDENDSSLFPSNFFDYFEVHSYRNAAQILHNSCRDEFSELTSKLMEFRIETANVVKLGGNKTEIAKSMDTLLKPIGWNETRVKADLVVRKIYSVSESREIKSGPRRTQTKTESVLKQDEYLIEDFIDGHKIDFMKNRIAFDLEWNSKDQTFDRDLYAARTFYECGLINAGIILTRSAELISVFQEISSRVAISDFKSKFGASTTWMGKLLYRLNAGRGGGCPILALGIRPALIDDFEAWKEANQPIRAPEVITQEETKEASVG